MCTPITDVTGFRRAGACAGNGARLGLSLVIRADDVPLLDRRGGAGAEGNITGASHRNWASYGASVTLPADLPEWWRHLSDRSADFGWTADRAARRSARNRSCGSIQEDGYEAASVIGHAEAAEAGINVRA